MRILIDGMGGDNAPEAIVQGAVEAVKEINDTIIIIGKSEEIAECLAKTGYKGDRIEIVNATEVIENCETPVKAVRAKKDSSIVKGITMMKKGEADAFISAGSTGAILAGGFMILGRIKGIDRPALATVYPILGKEPSFLIDTGANAECKPQHLLEFGIMGSVYMEKVLGRFNPSVGLVNNGAEEGKGTPLTKEAYTLLKESGLNFIGNVEARDIPNGICDVIVTDGFTGNVIVKLTEGMGMTMLKEIKKSFTSTMMSKFGAVLLKDQLRGMMKKFDYAEYGGAPILGIKGAILKMHGSSDARAVKQTILKTVPYVEEDVVGVIERAVVETEERLSLE